MLKACNSTKKDLATDTSQKTIDFKQLFIIYLISQDAYFLELHSVAAFLTQIKSYLDSTKLNCLEKNNIF